MRPRRQRLALVLACAGVAPAYAADLPMPARDPMQAPASVQAAQRGASASAPARADMTPRHVMLIEGRRYLLDRGRRLSVGDWLGTARIERIDDGAVWLREDGAVHQVSLFGGIVKRPVASPEAGPDPTVKVTPVTQPSTGKRP